MGCDCPQGFTGPVCEFSIREEKDHATCNLECQNGGICRKGAKDLSILDKFDFSRLDGSFDNTHTDDFEHCVCPIGYVGLTCEFKLDICPGGTHACMHGAECIPRMNTETNKLEFQCDCTKADEHGLRYAGEYCQFESTEFCTDNAARPPAGNDAFCVNGGECLDFVSPGTSHPGCQCKNDYNGVHCEYPPEVNFDTDIVDKGEEPKGGMAISLTLGCTFLVIFFIFFIVYRREKARELAFRPSGETYFQDDVEPEDSMSSNGDNVCDLGDFPLESAKAPTFSDIDYLNAISERPTCRDLIVLDDENQSVSTPPSEAFSQICSEPYTLGMSSFGTEGSSETTFSEDQVSGRAMLMKEMNESGSI